MEHVWNPFLTFVALCILSGVLYQLTEVWLAYAHRPPRCKCRCGKDV